jgi:tetratricopeptide (TPR) repeat protein
MRVAVCIALSLLGLGAARIASAQDALRPDEAGGRGPVHTWVTGDPFDNALRLARALHDDRLVATLLSQDALGPGTSSEDIAGVVEAFEALAEPESAQRFLEARVQRYSGERDTRAQLARLFARMGKPAASAEVWSAIEATGPLSIGEVDELAEALSAAGHEAAAYLALKAAASRAPEAAKDYWEDLAALAWNADDAPVALAAYRVVWAHDYGAPGAAQRLMTLAKAAGLTAEVIAVGLEDFRRNGEPASLLQVAEVQEQKGDWPELDRTLALALTHADDFVRRPEYWLLRGETSTHLGDHDGARKAYETALKLVPESPSAQAALLWDALDRNDTAALQRDVAAWRSAAEAHSELWAAYAEALARLGRAAEALPFFVRHFREDSKDLLFTLEFADVLERVGNGRLAAKTRAYALESLRHQALSTLQRDDASADDRVLVEETAQTIRGRAGAEMGERWLRAVRAASEGRADERPFFTEWYLSDDRADAARGELETRRRWKDTAQWQKYRLQLALADEDLTTVRALLASAPRSADEDRVEAELAIERDRAAVGSIMAALEAGESDADGWHERLLEYRDRHRPYVRAGGTYLYINGLDVLGPEVSVSHDAGPWRLSYGAAALRMFAPDHSLVLPSDVDEASGYALGRLPSRRGVSEVGAGVDVQSARADQRATAVPRATFFDQRQFTDALGTTLQAGFDEPIEDTSLLRVGALQSRVQAGVRADFASRWYGSLDVHVREDHTRVFHLVGAEVGEEAELGFKIYRRDPQWDVGVQAAADQRMNVTTLPRELAVLVPPGADLGLYLPPTYQLVSFVTHLSRGDFSQRYRPELTPFPRYDCEAAAGVLLPDLDAVVHVQCSASVLVARVGYLSAVAFYNRGVAGIADQTNAQATLNYTQTF